MRRIMNNTICILFSLLATPVLAQSESATTPADAPQLSKLPAVKQFVEATYPERARAEGIEAVVVLEIDIAASGLVEGARVVEPAVPAGYGFDEAAVEAVRRLEFEPAEAEGVPVPVTIAYRYGFALARPPAAASAEATPPALSINGRLLERGTRLPLAGVVVTVFRGEGDAAQGFEATTDAAGHFELFGLEPGEWKVLCDPAGYFPVRTAETFAASEVLEVTYFVERVTYNPFDVLVEARRPRKEVIRRTVQVEEIEKVPGTFGDPLGVVSNLPSVARSAFGGTPIVRGSAPEDTRISIGGVQIPYLYHFGGMRTALPAAMIDGIDFYPGNFSAYYGRATGGMLDVRPKRLAPQRLGGELDVSSIDSALYVETPIGEHAAIAVGGRRSYIDAILAATMPSDGPVKMTTAPRYYDYQLLGTVRPGAGHEITAMLFGSDDKMVMVFANPGDAGIPRVSTATRFYYGIIEDQWQISEGVANELKLAIGNTFSRTALGPERQIKSSFWTAHARETLRLRIAKPLELRVGADYIANLVDWDITFRRPIKDGSVGDVGMEYGGVYHSAGDDLVQHQPAGFLEAELTLGDLLVIPGIRVDYFGVPIEEVTYDPRLTARYRLTDKLVVKGGAGIYHQVPPDDETAPGFGNPDLQAFWANEYSVGAEYQLLAHLGIDATFFYKDVRHTVSPSDKLIERNGHLEAEVYNNDGRGRVYGLDLMIRHELANGFFGWIAYTLSRAERLDSGSTEWRLFGSDQTHILTVLGTYQLPRHWELGMRWRLVSGNPYTPYSRGVLDADQDMYLPIAGKVNSGRLPTFHQLDVRMDKRWVFDTMMVSAYIDIQNIYNRQNAEGVRLQLRLLRAAGRDGPDLHDDLRGQGRRSDRRMICEHDSAVTRGGRVARGPTSLGRGPASHLSGATAGILCQCRPARRGREQSRPRPGRDQDLPRRGRYRGGWANADLLARSRRAVRGGHRTERPLAAVAPGLLLTMQVVPWQHLSLHSEPAWASSKPRI